MTVLSAIEVEPMTPTIGAEVSGVNLADAPSAELVAELRRLLLRHGVLVFRDQDMLTPEGQIEFARCFGEVVPHARGEPSHPELVRIIHDVEAPPTENIWHADSSFLREPPLGAVLRAVDVPRSGGDTLFADMRAALRQTPESLQNALRDVRAKHDIAKWLDPATADEFHQSAPLMAHLVIHMHPETREEILYVNSAYTTEIIGLDDGYGASLLEFLLRQVSVPELQCRVRWRRDTVVLWDNRSVQHYATGDYLPARRVMERVTISAGGVIGEVR